MNRPETLVRVFEALTGRTVRRCLKVARSHGVGLAAQSDEQIAAACQRLVAAPKLTDSANVEPEPIRMQLLTDRDGEAIALAAEAFSRFPPGGLPRGSRLHDEQLLAAVHLLHGNIVQMDTGEGKTFAIAAAALALLRVHPKVYIVTANPYLAARDAQLTAPFWNALTISCGLVLPSEYGQDERAWEAQVVYTTFSTLAFRSMQEDSGETEKTLTWSVLLLDEADAVLLEQSGGSHGQIRMSDPRAKDWSEAIAIAQALRPEDIDVEFDLRLDATLKSAGEARVIALAAGGDLSSAARLVLMRDVELAYVALRVARDGHHFDVQGEQIVTIDPASGWHTPSIKHAWAGPLEQHLGLPRRPRAIMTSVVDGVSVIRRFAHVAGASGTVLEETLDYLLLLGLPPAAVKPRIPRRSGRLPDAICFWRQEAHTWVVEQVAEHGPHRPILVATDSLYEAIELAQQIEDAAIEGVTVRGVSGETIAEERIFETAGRPGMTIVSTRIAGRGVDIQLTPAARQAGGAMLLAVGHAQESRLDRQLLGRVGRQGDPYQAQFITHPEDSLQQMVANSKVTRLGRSSTTGRPSETRLVNRSTAAAQRQLRRVRMRRFAARIVEGRTNGAAFMMLREWQLHLGRRTDEELPPAFVDFLASRYLAARFPGLGFRSDETFAEPAPGVAEITRLLCRPGDADRLIVAVTEQPASEALQVFAEYVEERVEQAQQANIATRRELAERLKTAGTAVLDLQLLRFLRAWSQDCDVRAPVELMGAALSAAPAAPADIVARTTMFSRMGAIERWADAHGAALDGESDDGGSDDGEDHDGDLRQLLRVLAVGADEPAAFVDDVQQLIEQAERARRADAERLESHWQQQIARSPWAIASETIARAFRRLESGIEITRFEVQQTVSSARYTAVYRSRVEDLQREVEAELVADMCANLVAGASPADLDDLFIVREHSIRTHLPRMALALPVPSLAGPASPAPAPRETQHESASLIVEYVAAVRERFDEATPDAEQRLYPALKALVGASDLATLTNPDRVADALAGWKQSRTRARTPPWRRHELDGHVKGFLSFLHNRGLAAPLPSGPTQRTRSWIRRARVAVATPGLLLGIATFAVGLALALLLGVAPHLSDGLALRPAAAFADRLLSAGALASGSALAPALLAVSGGTFFRLLVGLTGNVDAGSHGFERTLTLLLIAAGAATVTRPWSHGIGASGLVACAAFVLVALVSVLIRNSTYLLEQMTHIRVSAGLTAGFAAFSAIPLLTAIGGTGAMLVIVAGCAILRIATVSLRQARVPVVALRIDDSVTDETTPMTVPLTVRAPVSVVPHCFALFFAWALGCVVLDLGPLSGSILAGITYLAILALWARSLARSSTNEQEWRSRMRERNQTYEPTASAPTLGDALRAARRKLFVLEMAVATVVVAGATAIAAGAPAEALRQLPLGLAAIAATVIAVDLGRTFVRTVPSATSGMAPTTSTFSGESDGGFGMFAADVIQHLAQKMGIVALAILVLAKIADLRDIVDLLVAVAEKIAGLV